MGINGTVISNPAFDAWTTANYNKTEHNSIGLNLDFDLLFSKYSAGICGDLAFPYIVADLYFGRRITPAPVVSYINFKIGAFRGSYNDIAPANYVAPSASRGDQFQLQNGRFYLGLESKNYISFPDSKNQVKRGKIRWSSGFFAQFGYMPWRSNWEYGYYTGSGRASVFHGTTVSGIPALSNSFIEAGIFVGIGS